jgi:hypothetical protein
LSGLLRGAAGGGRRGVLKNLKEERTRAFDYCMPYVFLPHKQSEADVRAPALAQPGAWRSGTRRVSGSGDPRASSARRPDLGLDLCPQVPDTCVDVMCEIPGRQAPLVFDFDWDMDEVAEVAEEKVGHAGQECPRDETCPVSTG